MGTMQMMMPEEAHRPLTISPETARKADTAASQVKEIIEQLSRGPEPEVRYILREITSSLNVPQAEDLTSSLAIAAEDLAKYKEVRSVPVVILETGPVTVSLNSLSSRWREPGSGRLQLPASAIRDQIQVWTHSGESRKALSFGEATHAFKECLKDFIGVRLSGLTYWAKSESNEKVGYAVAATGEQASLPTNSPDGDGLFRVIVRNRGERYRIFVSPAYFIDWLYFGYPSSPVEGFLLPGRYIFGTDSIDANMTEDRAVFQIPTHFTPELTRF